MKILGEERGSALVVALVASLIITVFALSLLALSYTVFNDSNQRKYTTQCKELAVSTAKAIDEQITGVKYNSFADQKSKVGKENNLWFFLRYNVFQPENSSLNWPYYNEDEEAAKTHDNTKAFREFILDPVSADGEDMPEKIHVSMAWKSSANAVKGNIKEGTALVVRVNVKKAGASHQVTTTYFLEVQKYDDGGTDHSTNDVNPYSNTIDTEEKWIWSLGERS